MVITHLGAKRLQGTKLDRVNDSLGSSADGVNTNVTIPLTWTNLTSNTSIASSKLNYTETASTYIRASRDLDGVITLADDFVIRFELNKTNNLGIPSLVSNDAENAGEGAGAVVYNMGGNVTDQSKKSVFMFPERHLFGERLQLGRV